jgi:hypothetical protein
MRKIIQFIRQYFYETDKKTFVFSTFIIAILIFINYRYGLNEIIGKKNSFPVKLLGWYAVFLFAFSFPYLIYQLVNKRKYNGPWRFPFLIVIAPLIFALKLTLDFHIHFSNNPNWNEYWNDIVYWPLLVIIILCLVYIIWKVFEYDQPLYGLTLKNISWRPYLVMLLVMLPLVALASTQPDFLAMYPRLKLIEDVYTEDTIRWWHKLLFELSYGSDFITIEFFFRGFLVLAFAKWAGKDVILPMACFYCTIHFGKPLGECISSYAGGILLGIVSYNTRSIFGGLVVHLGIAWLMELGGYIGNSIQH